MRSFLQARAQLIQVILGVIIASLAALDMIGKPARLVMILTLFAGALGAGIGIGAYVEKRRKEGRSSAE